MTLELPVARLRAVPAVSITQINPWKYREHNPEKSAILNDFTNHKNSQRRYHV